MKKTPEQKFAEHLREVSISILTLAMQFGPEECPERLSLDSKKTEQGFSSIYDRFAEIITRSQVNASADTKMDIRAALIGILEHSLSILKWQAC